MISWKKGTGDGKRPGEEKTGNTAADQRAAADG